MTTLVAVKFPLGRYHATPWDASVNEGRVEWPPSPWRILRALVSTFKTRLPHLPEGQVTLLFNRLLEEPPSYQLPPSGEAHTRHYMPTVKHALSNPGKNRSMAFDPFLSVSPDSDLLIEFTHQADEEERSLLSALLEATPYLGRADSVCHARLADKPVENGDVVRWVPGATDHGGTRLLAPVPPFTIEDLSESPTELRMSRRLDPTRTRWVDYKRATPDRPSRARKVSQPRRAVVDAVRWHLPDRGRPPVTETVAIADVLRRAVLSRSGRVCGEDHHPVGLSGRTDAGPSRTQHQHAHYLAFSQVKDGRIDTVAVWAPGGLSDEEVAAVGSLRQLWTPDWLRGLHTYRLGLEALGSVETVLREYVGPSRVWVSITPYAPGRRWCKNWNDPNVRLEHVTNDLKRELGFRTRPVPEQIEELDAGQFEGPDWRRFRRGRLRRGEQGQNRPAIPLRLTFEEPVEGPLVLGGLSHFGLGLFKPEG